MNREIPIIGDEMVDREFGTGAVKITPAHDPNDFEAGKRHGLPQIDVMTDDAHINENGGAYAGLERFAARKQIVEDLQAQGYLDKIEEHLNAIGHCERSRTIVEPRISTQWFCRMQPLAEPAIAAVERGDIQMVPENRRTEYLNWMRNIRDWTLSRQLWGDTRYRRGIAIAARLLWRGKTKDVPKMRIEHTAAGSGCVGHVVQLGLVAIFDAGLAGEDRGFRKILSDELADHRIRHPVFLVARMIMMGLHFTGQVPFRAVYLHSIVRTPREKRCPSPRGRDWTRWC